MHRRPQIIFFGLAVLITFSLSSFHIPLQYHYNSNFRILVVGDGDLSFSRFLAENFPYRSLQATTLDTKEQLFASFQNSEENVNAITSCTNCNVCYEIDATDLRRYFHVPFDLINWNFPHIAGKQNIKKNRELLFSFLKSANDVLRSNGSIILSLCEKQCGTDAMNRFDWSHSWKLTHQAAEAGFLVLGSEDFSTSLINKYTPMGHRGHGGNFKIGSAQVFTLTKASSGDNQQAIQGYQCPIYIHEVHLLSPTMVANITSFEIAAANCISKLLTNEFGFSALWSAHVVDLYICPRTNYICHALQVFCSL